ncbi:MAG TPA: hypothetical protein VGO90_13230, partial [Chthoniobacteraceae bacterium]|nr:hypothetical protein [Chthoniobacteraceae bacterium]
RNPDYTMEQVVEVARRLRIDHGFRGYIHLKTIPEASQALITEAGRWADRISINVELPTQEDLDRFAPEKNLARIEGAMQGIKARIDEAKGSGEKAPAFAPAGQSTQMIVGATAATDATILEQASDMYARHRLRRVYYSAFSPIPDASSKLPIGAAPLVREHRLYQADWLMRFYGFDVTELTGAEVPNLDLHIDPKLAWALRHPERFPVNLNSASREELLRVPGLGVRNVDRILAQRRWHQFRTGDLVRLRVPLKKVLPFIVTTDHRPGALSGGEERQREPLIAARTHQLELFGAPDSVRTGEL